MKKVILALLLFAISLPGFALDAEIKEEQSIQQRVTNCGLKILNANEIQKRVVFVYNTYEKNNLVKMNPSISKRQVVLYTDAYNAIENDDELAGFAAREIALAVKSFDGIFGGALRSLQMQASPKKFEIVADKRAVDYMVKAGYHPIGLITFIQKTSPQRMQDKLSRSNLTSKRLATIYEYIYTKYPYYLTNNPYLQSESYQNFLLTSYENRRKLEEKIETGSKKDVKYE